MNGDGTLLLASGKQYAERNDDGTYNGNIMQVINAVTCLDRPAPTGGVATYEKETKALAKDAPTWGSQLAWAGALLITVTILALSIVARFVIKTERSR